MHPARRCSSCNARVQKTAGCRQTLCSQLLLELPCQCNAASLEPLFCHHRIKAQNIMRGGLANTGADWRNKARSADDVPAPAWVNYIRHICISIACSKVCSAWSLYPVVNCRARLWKSTAVTFSPRHGYIPGAGDTISVYFLLPRPAELVLNLTFYLWKTLGILD